MILNKNQLASEVFSCTEETITQWQNAGMPVLLRRKGMLGNQYDVAACVAWRVARGFGDDVEGALDLNQERARLAKAQADKTSLEASELKGNLVHYEEISAHWTRHATDCKQKLLAIPQKVAPQVRAAATDQEAAAVIEAELFDALAELSGDGIPDSVAARRERSARFAPPAREVDDQSVGGQEPRPVARSSRRARSLAN